MSKLPPTFGSLKEDNVHDVLKARDREHEDCTPCRLVGSAAFTGLGAYTWYSGRKQLAEREAEILRHGAHVSIVARKATLLVMSLGLVGTGVYRLFN